MNKRVVSFDPGYTTGVFTCDGVREDMTFINPQSFEIPWNRRFEMIAEIFTRHQPDVVVVERFSLFRGRAKQQIGSTFPSVEIIGVISTYRNDLCPSAEIVTQPAWAKERTIRKLEESCSCRGPHTRDAMRHAIYYYVSETTMSPKVKSGTGTGG